MFTVIAFAEQRSDTTAGYIAGATDETHRVTGDDIYVGDWNLLLAAFVCSYSPQYTYLISPSLRRTSQVYISHQYIPGAPSAFDRLLGRGFGNPLTLDKMEALNCYQAVGGYNASRVELCGVWLADAPISPITGEIFTIRINSEEATSFTKGVWLNHELTYTPDLPVGRYAVVGARMYGADYGLFRFNFRGIPARPGGIVIPDERLAADKIFREGRLGVWGEFDSVLPPSMDVLLVSTNATTQLWGFMDIIKIA